MEYVTLMVTLLAGWFLADIITGTLHWVQDQYLSGKTTNFLLKGIAQDNDLHHTKPAEMGKRTLWENTTTSIIVSIPLFGICYLTSASTVWWFGIFFGIFANAIHSFTHKPKSKIPKIVQTIQKTGMFQSTQHHAIHHFNKGKVIQKEDTTCRYCVMTNWINPILDTIKFFYILEYVIDLAGFPSHRLKKLQNSI
jgi:ubiquitin-conjugating enzyme E2 variant